MPAAATARTGPAELGAKGPLLLTGRLDIPLGDGSRLEIDVDAIVALSERDRARAFAAMREIEQKLLRNPLLRYQPASPRHATFHAAWEAPKAFFGGNRAAKTTTSSADDLIQMTPDELLPPRLRPYKKWDCRFYCRVMAPDMASTV
jgi:hypothetical protein